MTFYTADLTDEEYEEHYEIARGLFTAGCEAYPISWSTSVCENLTAGYGRLDAFGYWEFPLQVYYREDGSSYAKPHDKGEVE